MCVFGGGSIWDSTHLPSHWGLLIVRQGSLSTPEAGPAMPAPQKSNSNPISNARPPLPHLWSTVANKHTVISGSLVLTCPLGKSHQRTGLDEASELWAHQPHLMPTSSASVSREPQVLSLPVHWLLSRKRATIFGPYMVHSPWQQRQMSPYLAQDGSPSTEEQVPTQS